MSELIERNGKQYTKKEIKDIFQLIEDIFSKVAKMVSGVIKRATEIVKEYYDKKQVYYNWIVPMDMAKPSQIPRMPCVAMPCIRNNI